MKAFSSKAATRRGWQSVFVTALTAFMLAIFLSPFLYMILSSLKTPEQLALFNSPIWPARMPTCDYQGKTLEILTVPLADGTTKDLAMLKKGTQKSVFVDCQNPDAGEINWEGSWRTLKRPWIFSPTWSNYTKVWTVIDFPRLLGNTMFYAFVTVVGTVVSNLIVAYGFSRFRFPGRNFLFIVMISVLFLPGTVTIIPTFTFWTRIGLVGTWWPLILPHFFTTPFNTFLLRQYFLTLPRELDESAFIDGASPLRVLWSVIIPQSYPVIIAITVFHIVWAWNDYFSPLIYLSTKPELQPVSVALARFNGLWGQEPQLIQAGALMMIIIPLALFFMAQRFFVQGIVITGVEK